MPVYLYECQSCQERFETMVPIAQRNAPQECPGCGEKDSRKVVTAANINFPGDGWVSKNGRIEKQMRDKNTRLTKKEEEQRRSGRVPTLAPNVGGERCDSWADAVKLAKDKGKDTSGYEANARKEKTAS